MEIAKFDTSAEELKLEDIDFESIQDGYKICVSPVGMISYFFFQLLNFMRVNPYQLLHYFVYPWVEEVAFVR